MNQGIFKNRVIAIQQILAIAAFLLTVFGGSASAIIMTATPPSNRITPGINNSIQVFYRAFQLDAPTFTAISTSGRFETAGGTVLGTVNSTLTITLVNNRGTTTETVIVPSAVIRTAIENNLSTIYYRRTFADTDPDTNYPPDTAEVQLQMAPASAATFSLARLKLEFNQPGTSGSTRSASGGRITVPRNTRGLAATATLTYTGGGTLRGQWKVDGQLLSYVTRYLAPGIREVNITSPVAPSFPTYASGLHRVEFEILDPAPGFSEPIIFYYVSDTPPGPTPGSLRLISPLEKAHILIARDNLPEFSWQPAGNGVVYHFQIYGLGSPAAVQDLSQIDFSGHKPLLAALTRDPSYKISIFDLERIIPDIPYVWRVQAFNGRTGLAASFSRIVYFHAPAPGKTPAEKEGHEEVKPQAGAPN
ncbi:MAG: hypothetical protein JXK94_03550 [Deltaproteobacteria bacterium]|nr:hypothetical protein [Deltaproteobacteria bacterium]